MGTRLHTSSAAIIRLHGVGCAIGSVRLAWMIRIALIAAARSSRNITTGTVDTPTTMELRPISIRDAMTVVTALHRHLERPTGAKLALSAFHGGQLVGVALVGRPVSRVTQRREPLTAEVIRVATDGTPNACSFLYARAKRAAQALGFVRVLTKTLPEESGASLRAVGATFIGMSKGGQWDRVNRERAFTEHDQPKMRWEL